MTYPLVSILIPCYNAEKYVGEAIDSALGQTYENIEVIVVDDGSTDNSVAILESYAARIEPARFQFVAGPNRGGNAARNQALTMSKGSLIQFLDADDVLLPEKIERQAAMLANDSTMGIVFCQGEIFGEGISGQQEAPHPPAEGDALEYMLKYSFQTGTPLHRRSLLEAVNGFREELRRGQEMDLHLRLVGRGARIEVLPGRLIRLRRHDGPRVSRRPVSADHNLKILVNLAKDMESAGTLTSNRREIVANAISRLSIFAFRNGATESAHEGFSVARRIAGRAVYPETRRWVRAIAHCVGPARAEASLALVRRLLGRTKD